MLNSYVKLALANKWKKCTFGHDSINFTDFFGNDFNMPRAHPIPETPAPTIKNSEKASSWCISKTFEYRLVA